jgi:glycosyltransferase involved in cell wall biosynthesis
LKYRSIFNRLAKTAEHILTVSEFSKGEIHRWLKVPAERITVAYEGREHIERVQEDNAVLSRIGIGEKPFFLVVGSRSLHKNLRVVMEANAVMDRSGFDIVIIGARNDRVFTPVFENAAENVINAGYLKDGELKALYKNACALIFPSLYEGFGLPLLEAMACGCPVLCSDIPTSHEVCSHAALYFDPYSPADLGDKMRTILGLDVPVGEMRAKGAERAAHFSWRSTAETIRDVIDRYR